MFSVMIEWCMLCIEPGKVKKISNIQKIRYFNKCPIKISCIHFFASNINFNNYAKNYGPGSRTLSTF